MLSFKLVLINFFYLFIDFPVDRQMDGWMDGWMDGRINEQSLDEQMNK